MTDLSGPPFRADHVGSLLRPPELLRARAEHQAGRISAAELRAGRGRGDPRCRADAAGGRAPGGNRRRVPPRLVAHGFSLSDRRGRPSRTRPEHPVQERGAARSSSALDRASGQRQAQARRDDLRRGFRLSEIGGPGGDDAEADDPVAVDAALPRRAGGDRRRGLSRYGGFLARPRRRLCRGDRRRCTASAAPICSSTTPASPI